jgi:hypothetical protein
MIIFYLTAFVLTGFNVAIWKNIDDEEKEHIQTHAPRWIPRNVLFECMLCTSFWLSVPGAAIAVFLTSNWVFTALPFVAACFTFLYFDIEHKLK